MPALFIILFKINVVLLLFAAAYYGVLRRLTFYTLNRLFLVFGIVFASAYPFIDLTDFFMRHQPSNRVLPGLGQRVVSLAAMQQTAWFWLSVVFYAGACILAARLCVQFVSLYRLHRQSRPGSAAGYPVRVLAGKTGPFSFWRTVYVNPDLHGDNELRAIVEHERVHVRDWHTADLLLAELSVVLYWFNPGIWLIKKAVKENLEFITDDKVLRQGIDRKTYQYSLLEVGNFVPATPIASNFSLSDLKKRIRMMNVKRSSPVTLGRYALVLPVLLVTTLAFTISKKELRVRLAPLKIVMAKPASATAKAIVPRRPAPVAASVVGKTRYTIQVANEPEVLSIRLDEQLTAPDTLPRVEAITISEKPVTVVKVTGRPIPVATAVSTGLADNQGPGLQEVTVVGHRVRPKNDSVRVVVGHN